MNTQSINRRRWTSGELAALFILGLVGGIVLGWTVLLISAPAYAADAQPYGGCDEAWQAPQSPGADECRDAGWVIRSNLVVGPHHWVHMSTLDQCANEDGSPGPFPCSWNFDAPRSWGLKFYVTGTWNHHRYHYVNGVVR